MRVSLKKAGNLRHNGTEKGKKMSNETLTHAHSDGGHGCRQRWCG